MPEMKQFTVEQANATLPLVRRIVEDVVLHYKVWSEKILEIDLVAASGRAADAVLAERLAHDAQSIAREIDGFRRELAELGILLKDPAIGLIDFPGTMGDRPVLLCWRLGEAEIAFWHDLNAGYAGRQPLVPASVN